MELKDLLNGILSKVYNIDELGVASLYNEDGSLKSEAESTILEWDSERVKNLKTGSQKQAEEAGYSRGKAEVMTKFENDFKAKTGFKSDKKGVDLVLDYANETAKQKGELTDDLIKKHPLYLSLQEEKEAAIQDALRSGEEKLTKFQSELNKKETFNNVAKKAIELFHGLKPVLSSDPVKAKRQEELFLEKLQGLEYEIQDGERIVILKDGKLHEDGHGNPIKLDKLVKDLTYNYFDIHEVDPKKSAGNKNSTQPVKSFNFEMPKTPEQYAKIIADPNVTLEEKHAVKQAYAQQNQQS